MSERYANSWQRELATCLEPVHAPESLWYQVEANLARPSSRPRSAPLLAAGLLLAVAVAASALWHFARPVPSLETAALQAHREFVDHPERLDLRESNPAAVRRWIAARTALAVGLHDRDSVEILGARLLKGGRAAVFYRIGGYPVTLVAAKFDADLAGRVEPMEHAKLFTWKAHGQAYTLVSGVPGNGRQACGACHTDENTHIKS